MLHLPTHTSPTRRTSDLLRLRSSSHRHYSPFSEAAVRAAPDRIAPAMALPVRFANGFLIEQNTKARAFGDSQDASFRCQHFGIGDEAQQIVAHIIMEANQHRLNWQGGDSTGKMQETGRGWCKGRE